MLRRIRLVTKDGSAVSFVYYVNGAKFLGVQRVIGAYDASIGIASAPLPLAFDGGIKLGVYQTGTTSRTYDFYIDVSDNQPADERVEEASSTKSAITVYNENGVAICDNGVAVTASSSSPSQSATAPGEMTSVPIEAPGEII